jgi:hypothetical protein
MSVEVLCLPAVSMCTLKADSRAVGCTCLTIQHRAFGTSQLKAATSSLSHVIVQALRHFLREVGKGAEYARTGAPLSESAVAKLLRADDARESTLIGLRLKNIELTTKCAAAAVFRYFNPCFLCRMDRT